MSPRHAVWGRLLPLAAASCLAAAHPATARAQADRVQALETEVAKLGERVDFVLDQYGRAQPTLGIGGMQKRFSEAEIRFLLEDYGAAAVFLYDLVESEAFKQTSQYDTALFYLAESLYHLESYLPAKKFFRELLDRGVERYRQEALQRLIQIAGKLRSYEDIEAYVDRFLEAGGRLKPEVSYVYGKFLFERRDLPLEERIRRAMDAFERVPINTTYGLKARYFQGVLHVQEGNLDEALEAFQSITRRKATKEDDLRVQELAWMAVGRIHYERGEYELAMDAYSRIDRQSDLFFDALYEIAWTQVKRKNYEGALKAAEVLLIGAEDSPLAPEARILMGTLYARAKKYDEALKTYNEVINEYAPVRDEIEALLALHADPVEYFNELIAREGEHFSVESVLPPLAAKWASTQEDVAQAFGIVTELQKGKAGVREGNEIADRILASLDAGTLGPFPTLAEAYQRSTEVQNQVLSLRTRATTLETQLLSSAIPEKLAAELAEARRERERLEREFRTLPTNADEVEARKKRWLAKVEEVEKEAFRLRLASTSLNAQLTAIRKWLQDTKQQRNDEEEALKEFLERMEREKEVVDGLYEQAQALLREIAKVKDGVRSGTIATGDDTLRARYEAALERERQVASKARAAARGVDQTLFTRLDRAAAALDEMNARLESFKHEIQRRADARRQVLRQQVLIEQRRLNGYGQQVEGVMSETHDLVGEIAFNSFRKVQRQFYELILKADVGIIDVAWARKQDKSKEIQRLAQEKDQQLRLLDVEFQEVLQEE